MTTNFILRLIVFSCRFPLLRRPRWIAFLFAQAVRSTSAKDQWRKTAPYTLLVLPRSGLVEDIESAFADTNDFRILQTPVGLMKSVVYSFLPKTIDDNNYFNLSVEEENAKDAYRGFMSAVLRHLRKTMKLDAITSANFAYFAEREVHRAAGEAGLSFIVLHKESLKSPGRRDYFETTYRDTRGRFWGQKILVYNQLEKDIQISAEVVTDNEVEVCGMSRLDRNHAWRMAEAGKQNRSSPNILFLLFGKKTGLPSVGRKLKGEKRAGLTEELARLSWQNTFDVTVRSLLEFATANPGVTINIKAKLSMAGIISDVEALADETCGGLPKNIRIVAQGDPLELMSEAWVVLGMNSTALLEAMAMGKTVISPNYEEAAQENMKPWIADFGEALIKVDSAQMLKDKLSEMVCGLPPKVSEELSDQVCYQLDYWTGNSDGRAGQRVHKAFCRAIEERKS